MFGNDREGMRRYYRQCWQRFQAKQPLDPLAQQVAQVVAEHPEYHALLTSDERAIQYDYLPEQGETNPFLHMGLHLALREQAATDRPLGIAAIYQRLTATFGTLEAEHRMMECLAESLWLAQRDNVAPDETRYLEALRRLG